jgi:hypothetical protein
LDLFIKIIFTKQSNFTGATMKNLPRLLPSTFLVLLAAVALLYSDGETRKAKQEEKDFYKEVATTLSNVVPKCPEGWTETKDEVNELEDVGKGSEKSPFRIFFNTEWNDYKRKSAADEAVQKALMPVMTNPVRKAEMQKITKESERLAKEFGEAFGKNNQARAQSLQKEIETQSKKMTPLIEAQDREMDSVMEKTSARDVQATIRFSVNEFYQWAASSTEPSGQIAGCPSFKTRGGWTKERGWIEETTYIVVGKEVRLDKSAGLYIQVKEQKGAPSLAVQSIIVSVQANPQRTQQIIEKINWNALKKLWKK